MDVKKAERRRVDAFELWCWRRLLRVPWTARRIITILRAVHKYKDSREQFELRTHKRLIDILKPSAKIAEALMNIELPAGVEIEVKV